MASWNLMSSGLFYALAKEKWIKLIFAVISKGFSAYRNLQSACHNFPLLLAVPLAGYAAAQEQRIRFIVPIVAKGLPTWWNLEADCVPFLFLLIITLG